MASASSYNPNNWILDSGATHHLMTDLSNLSLHQPYTGGEEVTIADGSGLSISHTCSTSLKTLSRSFTLNDILYVPNLHKNFISVYRLCNSNNVSVEFFPAHFQVNDLSTGVRLLQSQTKEELYEWHVTSSNTISLFATPTPKTSISFWHSRLGHPSLPVLQNVVSKFSLPLSSSSQKPCSHCFINKSHKLPFYSNTIVSTQPLQYIYTDVWTSPTLSIDQFKYYLIFVDHYTRYTWFYPLKQKSQVKPTFITFKALVEKHFDSKIRNLYSDNGGEFIALRSFLSSHGISHLTSPPHTQEHNGIAERKHRHIVETGLTLLHEAKIPTTYWTYSFVAAVYLINRLPSAVINNASPYQKLFGKPPNYLKLRIFGCLCFPWLRPYTAHKLDGRSLPCVFLGYSITESAYLCLHLPTGRIYTSHHVQFVESTFPYASQVLDKVDAVDTQPPLFTPPTHVPIFTAPLVQHSTPPPPSQDPQSPVSQTHSVSHEQNNNLGSGIDSTNTITSSAQVQPETSTSSPSTSPSPNLLTHTTQPEPSPNQQNLNTQPTPSVSSTDLAQPAPQPSVTNAHPMQTRAKNKISKPAKKLTLLATNINPKPSIPTTLIQAMRDENWRQSMCDEYNAQLRNETFELVPPNPTQHVIATKWVHTLKYLPNGVLDRYKSRLVARGNNQEYGIDYAETFSPVVKSITIRLVLQLAVSRSWGIKQLDVNNALLQGTLTDAVFVTQPPGFVDQDRPHHVCRLKKALYGLKQAPRAWYQELKTYLCDMGCRNSLADTSAFIYINGSHVVYILVYVDDIIVTGSSNELLTGSYEFSLHDSRLKIQLIFATSLVLRPHVHIGVFT